MLYLVTECVHAGFVSAPPKGLRTSRFHQPVPSMASVGDVWSGIEQMSRLLDENRQATTGILIRKKQLMDKPVSGSMREHQWLNGRFSKLVEREKEIQAELERLIVVALLHQIEGEDDRQDPLP